MAQSAENRSEAAGIGIADLLGALRDDIEESQRRLNESGKPAMFTVDDVEVEVGVTVTRRTSGSGGVKVTVLGLLGADASGSHERGRDTVNRLTLKLKPLHIIAGGVAGGTPASNEPDG